MYPIKHKPIYKNIDSAPFRIGEFVKVLYSADETFERSYIGKAGLVVYLEYSCGCGQSFPSDPMIGVLFNDLTIEEFWKEELELPQKNY
jgi:hypothetical protein